MPKEVSLIKFFFHLIPQGLNNSHNVNNLKGIKVDYSLQTWMSSFIALREEVYMILSYTHCCKVNRKDIFYDPPNCLYFGMSLTLNLSLVYKCMCVCHQVILPTHLIVFVKQMNDISSDVCRKISHLSFPLLCWFICWTSILYTHDIVPLYFHSSFSPGVLCNLNL